MTNTEFRERLRALGLSPVEFARTVSELAGEELSKYTVANWAQGHRSIPATVPALLHLIERVPE